MFISKIKLIQNPYTFPHPHRLIHNHYALIIKKDKAMIFTTNPQRTPKSYYISHQDIEGNTRNQYLSGHVYKVEPSVMSLEYCSSSEEYIKANFKAINKAYTNIDLETCIELSQHIVGEIE